LKSLDIDHINPNDGDDDSNLIVVCGTCCKIVATLQFLNQCENFEAAYNYVQNEIERNKRWFKENVLPYSKT